MKKILLGGIALATLIAAPAMAADLPARPEVYRAPQVYTPAYSWTGFYIGANGGWGWSNYSVSEAPFG